MSSRARCETRPGDLRERIRSEEHTSELQSHSDLVCRLPPMLSRLFPTRRSSDLKNCQADISDEIGVAFAAAVAVNDDLQEIGFAGQIIVPARGAENGIE